MGAARRQPTRTPATRRPRGAKKLNLGPSARPPYRPFSRRPGSHHQPRLADLPLVSAIGQSEGALQNPFDGLRKSGDHPARRGHFDHLPAASQQVSQARLVHRLPETPIHRPAIPHQKPGKVFAQHCRRLLEPPSRLNRVHRRLRRGEHPQPPESAPNLPARLVRRDAGTGSDLLDQAPIGGLGLAADAGDRLAEAPAGYPQPEGLLQNSDRLAVGQPQALIQLGRQRHRPRPQLRSGATHRIRALPRVTTLHPASAHAAAPFPPCRACCPPVG